MPRTLDASYLAKLQSAIFSPAVFVALTFATGTQYAWSGVGQYSWNGQLWSGLGDMGSVSAYNEGSDVQASGMSLTLSGIDNTLLGDSLAEIQLGAPATVYLAMLDSSMNVVGTPAVWFGGLIDQPSIRVGSKKSTIALALETRAIRMHQGQRLKYTNAEQRRLYPTDIGFQWVEKLNDIALLWQ